MKTKADIKGMLLQAKERTPKIGSKMPGVKAEAGNILFFTAPWSNQPCPDPDLRLGASRRVSYTLLLFQTPSSGILLP